MQSKQCLSLDIQTPSTGWKLNFISVYENKDKIIAVAKLTEPNNLGLQLIKKINAQHEINQFDFYSKPVSYYVLAQNIEGWWLQDNKFKAIQDLESIHNLVNNMHQIYSLDDIQNLSHSIS